MEGAMKHFYLVLSSTILAAISLASTTVAADDSHHKPLSIQAYLAGPDVFEPNPIAIGERKKAICAKHGLTCHFPMDNKIEDFDLSAKTGLKIGRLNEKLMDKSAIILANMTPWHGPGMDTGTAFEMGYMRAQGKIVIGYPRTSVPSPNGCANTSNPKTRKSKNTPMAPLPILKANPSNGSVISPTT